jgi:hypothetical protein
MNHLLKLVVLATISLMGISSAYAAKKPNIVVVFIDNFGWGEPGFNGGVLLAV